MEQQGFTKAVEEDIEQENASEEKSEDVLRGLDEAEVNKILERLALDNYYEKEYQILPEYKVTVRTVSVKDIEAVYMTTLSKAKKDKDCTGFELDAETEMAFVSRSLKEVNGKGFDGHKSCEDYLRGLNNIVYSRVCQTVKDFDAVIREVTKDEFIKNFFGPPKGF